MDPNASFFIADGHGLAGNAIRDRLEAQGCHNLLSADSSVLMDAARVARIFSRVHPEYVFLIGGKSGGIRANQSFPAELMRDNLLAGCHVMQSAREYGAKKLLYLGSSCAYPKFCQQPMQIEALMTGKLEPTNEA
jgi:GDP-L-fucose synthase